MHSRGKFQKHVAERRVSPQRTLTKYKVELFSVPRCRCQCQWQCRAVPSAPAPPSAVIKVARQPPAPRLVTDPVQTSVLSSPRQNVLCLFARAAVDVREHCPPGQAGALPASARHSSGRGPDIDVIRLRPGTQCLQDVLRGSLAVSARDVADPQFIPGDESLVNPVRRTVRWICAGTWQCLPSANKPGPSGFSDLAFARALARALALAQAFALALGNDLGRAASALCAGTRATSADTARRCCLQRRRRPRDH